jgi:hypothetical protein
LTQSVAALSERYLKAVETANLMRKMTLVVGALRDFESLANCDSIVAKGSLAVRNAIRERTELERSTPSELRAAVMRERDELERRADAAMAKRNSEMQALLDSGKGQTSG